MVQIAPMEPTTPMDAVPMQRPMQTQMQTQMPMPMRTMIQMLIQTRTAIETLTPHRCDADPGPDADADATQMPMQTQIPTRTVRGAATVSSGFYYSCGVRASTGTLGAGLGMTLGNATHQILSSRTRERRCVARMRDSNHGTAVCWGMDSSSGTDGVGMNHPMKRSSRRRRRLPLLRHHHRWRHTLLG